MSNIPTPSYEKKAGGFVFGDAEENHPNKILEIAEAKTYLVSYADAEGKKQTRLAFRIPGSKATFLFNERIQGSFVATIAAEWFQKDFWSKVKTLGLEDTGDESTEGVGQV